MDSSPLNLRLSAEALGTFLFFFRSFNPRTRPSASDQQEADRHSSITDTSPQEAVSAAGTSTSSTSNRFASFRSSSIPTSATAGIPKLENCVLG